MKTCRFDEAPRSSGGLPLKSVIRIGVAVRPLRHRLGRASCHPARHSPTLRLVHIGRIASIIEVKRPARGQVPVSDGDVMRWFDRLQSWNEAVEP